MDDAWKIDLALDDAEELRKREKEVLDHVTRERLKRAAFEVASPERREKMRREEVEEKAEIERRHSKAILTGNRRSPWVIAMSIFAFAAGAGLLLSFLYVLVRFVKWA